MACPEGATLVGAPPPKGNVIQCVLPNGAPHGLSSVWFEGGHEGTLTEYKNGVRHGRWMYWLHNHTLAEGQFEDGRRHGTWTFWYDQGSGFDMRSRYERGAYNGKNYVTEQYNKGLLLKSKRYQDAKPVPEEQAARVEAVPVLPGDAKP
jgi:antitoxin component YwqK of YwqJK toxin-antitoxin module